MINLPTPPRILTAAELARATAGGYNYIRTNKKQVKGLAIRPDRNPHAPKVAGEAGAISFGVGKRRKWSAYLYLESGVAVPVYVKLKNNSWEYIGLYRATDIREDPATILKYCERHPLHTQAGVLFIAPVGEPEVEVSGGGFADLRTRQEIELAAIAFATVELTRRGYQVKDCQSDNRGYDLLAVSPEGKRLVEVKGTDASVPRFFLTRAERKCGNEQNDWRLFVVCNARTSPIVHEFTADEMVGHFSFDPLAWECMPKTR